MKFIPRADLMLLEVASTNRVTNKGIVLPDGAYNIDEKKPMKVIAVGKYVQEFEVGQTVLLDGKPVQFHLPNDQRVLVLVRESDVAGVWEA